jgi:hypothetical protein
MKQTGQVPKALQAKYDAIVALTDAFCQQYLTEEYRQLSRRMAAKLSRKRPSPLATGKPNAWACGIVYVLGRVNFLFDKSQTPYMRADELCRHFGVSPSTGSAKAKTIMDIDVLDIVVAEPEWTLPSRLKDNPVVWLVQVNGLIVDVRKMPREIQEEAFRRGIIPFLP